MRGVLALALLLFAAPAAAQPVPAADVRAAITEIADAIDTVLLDHQGRARGDYDWQSGSWREYEVAWHTGQAIKGLLWAHRATGEQRYLDRAKQAGDYWVGLELKDGPFKGMINAAHGDRLGRLIQFHHCWQWFAGTVSAEPRNGGQTLCRCRVARDCLAGRQHQGSGARAVLQHPGSRQWHDLDRQVPPS